MIIEILRTGTHTAMNGKAVTFAQADKGAQ